MLPLKGLGLLVGSAVLFLCLVAGQWLGLVGGLLGSTFLYLFGLGSYLIVAYLG